MTSSISVIIASYNVEPYLAAAIESALAQTRQPLEIIVIDDCSTDKSVSVAEKFGNRVQLLKTRKNGGSARSRNLAVRQARGDFIAFLDGDDYWLLNHLEVVAGLLDRHADADLAFSSTQAFGVEQWVWPMVLPDDQSEIAFWKCIARTMIPQMNVVLRKTTFDQAGGFRDSFRQAQDFDLYLRLSYDHKFVCSHLVTSHYRRHEQSITRLQPKRALRAQYLARYLFWQENQARLDPESRNRYSAAVREIWVEQITACAQRLDFGMLEFHLQQRELIPGAVEQYQRWRTIRRVESLRGIWAKLPLWFRRPLRPFVRHSASYIVHDKSAMGAVDDASAAATVPRTGQSSAGAAVPSDSRQAAGDHLSDPPQQRSLMPIVSFRQGGRLPWR